MKRIKIITKISENFRGGTRCDTPQGTHNVKNAPQNTEYEKCVMCGEMTNIPIPLPITCRKNYVEGIGQLCEKCQNKLNREAQNDAK